MLIHDGFFVVVFLHNIGFFYHLRGLTVHYICEVVSQPERVALVSSFCTLSVVFVSHHNKGKKSGCHQPSLFHGFGCDNGK